MKRKLLPGAGLLKPLLLTAKVIMLCLLLCPTLSVLAGAHSHVHKNSSVGHKHKKALILNPTLSYKTPVTAIKGVAMPSLTPTSTGVGSLGYNTPVIIGQTGIHLPSGVAADANGNVYISSHERDFNTFITVVPPNGAPQTQIGFGLTTPGPMTIDANGDVFVIDGVYIKEILAHNTNTITIGTTGPDSSPDELAVDALGDIFVGDGIQGQTGIKEFPCVGGVYSGSYAIIGSGFSQPYGVAVDTMGNVYVSDFGNNAIKKITVATGVVTIVAPFSSPGSLAMDPSGDLFLNGGGDTYGSITELPAGHYDTPIVYGSGIEAPEFLSADPSGNVYLIDESHDEVREIPAGNGTMATVAPGFYTPAQIALDAAGDVFVADAGNGVVREIPVSGSAYPLTVAPAFNFSLPYGIAVDAADNVYVGDAGTGVVYKMAPGASTPTVLASNLSNVLSIAVDTKGNVYACTGNADLYKIAAGSNTATVANSGFKQLSAVALDARGNVYGYDRSKSNVYKLPPGGAGTPVILATGISEGNYLTVDVAGNVYISFNGNPNPSGIKEISAVDGTVTMVATTVASAYGIAIDGTGNLYSTDEVTSNMVDNDIEKFTPGGGYYLNTALPAGLSFDNTTGIVSGTPLALTAPANYTVTAYNSSGSTSATFNLKVIIPPPLVIKAKDETAPYNGAIPTLEVTYSGFINGDTKASLTTQPTVSTTAVTGSAPGTYPITASGAVDPNYTITYEPGTLTVAPSADNNLSGIHLADPYAALTTTTGTGAVNYKASVSNATTTITETATSADPAATIKINSQAATAGSASATVALSVGTNLITTVVTAQNGSTKTYTITVTRAPSSNAYLSSLKLESPYAALTASTGAGYKNYTASVSNATTSVSVVAVTADATATITVNGGAATSGDPHTVALSVGANPINVEVTAADGTTKDYIITVTRAKSANANLSSIELAHPYAALTAIAGPDDGDYTATVSSTTAAIDEVAKTGDPTAVITINGTTVASGADSSPITLAEGNTIITTVVTAQDGSTKKTYVVTVSRPMALAHVLSSIDDPISITGPSNDIRLNGDDILVHQGVSPNGDGINDFLQIDGITNYPDNKLLIMNREGLLVYEAKGYDNSTRVFDGHSSKNGQMQLPGTYFFSLDYNVKGVTQHKTGCIVLKY